MSNLTPTAERRRLHFFRRNTPIVTVVISNLSLINIPTQATRIFIKVKHGRLASAFTPSVEIVDNSAEWKNPLRLQCRPTVSLSRGKPMFLRFSFRLEDASGRGYTRYGIAEQDLALVPRDENWFFVSQLSECSYSTKFQCTLYIPDKVARPSEEPMVQNEIQTAKQIWKARSAPVLLEKPSDETGITSDDEPMDLPIWVSEERMDALARQVDEIWSDVLGGIDELSV
jgi:hypothetical protein